MEDNREEGEGVVTIRFDPNKRLIVSTNILDPDVVLSVMYLAITSLIEERKKPEGVTMQ